MTLFTVVLLLFPHGIADHSFTRDDQTLDCRTNDSFPRWDVHFIYKYTPENSLVNVQKLDDTENTPFE